MQLNILKELKSIQCFSKSLYQILKLSVLQLKMVRITDSGT